MQARMTSTNRTSESAQRYLKMPTTIETASIPKCGRDRAMYLKSPHQVIDADLTARCPSLSMTMQAMEETHKMMHLIKKTL